ncbi:carboxy terminal-processing peptidase [Pelistega sp. MC2]|uniref:carboxy terminal-processing peptidase n=1 Tax=Pelistega sp. MC2 TaxID=1720297 RepID=UPI000B0D8ABA|nr:carboxy terminal-processing peptidase [Pelistega sp. MC2]
MNRPQTKLKNLVFALSFSLMTGCVYADKAVDVDSIHNPQASSVVLTKADAKSIENNSTGKNQDFPPLKPEINFARASVIVANVLTRFEYDKRPLDVKMGHEVYDAYFKALDPQKMFFTSQDLEYFKPGQSLINRLLLEGDLRFAFNVYSRYREVADKRYKYAIGLLDKPFDFTVQEEFNVDRRKTAQWPKTDDEANDLWRRRVKNDFLRLKLANMDDDKIRETLRKRYTNNRNQIVRMKSEDVAEMFLNAYTDSTDPHTSYYSPTSAKNFDVQLSLSVEGIGAVLQKRDEYGQIREVVAGGPAARGGQLQPGDRIVAVGQGENGPMEDVVDLRLDDIVKKIRGKRGSVVRIEVIPADGGLDGKHRTIRIVREKVTMEDQAARSKIYETNVDNVKRKIGIITVPSFYEDFEGRSKGISDYKSVTRDVNKILEDYHKQNVEAVVLDLRGNGGGSLNEAANLSGLFLGHHQNVVQVRSADGSVSNVDSQVEKIWDKPVVVIVNRISASASEIFAAAIQDYGRGLVVGDPTWGKGTVQTFRPLSDFLKKPEAGESLGALKWTIQKFFRVNGSSTQVKGVTPDIQFPSGFDPKELGESSYDNAMPWTKIEKAEYKPAGWLSTQLKELASKHEKRVKASDSWQLMTDETDYALKLSQRKTYSLNLKQRENERKKMNETYQDFEKRRKALGESDLATFKLDDGLAMGEGNLKEELEDEKKRKENLDTIAKESANIAADLVSLQQK